jgi:hypothetical protein
MSEANRTFSTLLMNDDSHLNYEGLSTLAVNEDKLQAAKAQDGMFGERPFRESLIYE